MPPALSICACRCAQVRGEVEAGLAYLLEKRGEDPYRDLLPRLLYEASWGGGRQAPSFEP